MILEARNPIIIGIGLDGREGHYGFNDLRHPHDQFQLSNDVRF